MLVFSKEKYFKSMGVKRKKDIENWPFHWPSACDGAEVINGSCGCWNINDSWCIDTDKQSELNKLIPDNTRREAHEIVKKSVNKRYIQILEILKGRAMTAREVAEAMYYLGYTNTKEGCSSRPRLTELCDLGKVKTVGTKKDPITGKNVSLYQIIEV